MKIKNQEANLKTIKESYNLVEKLMNNMNENELIFFANSIRTYIDLRLLEKMK